MLKIVVSEDKETVEMIRQGLRDNNGHCPCSTIPTLENKCLCKEFREQNTEGYCHCKLYKKVSVKAGVDD